ncbi:MAG: TonB-dependent receptor [Proteobacteria bacterium]|nr:TonB-dependent receptor [Pseudomonadota bacterium]
MKVNPLVIVIAATLAAAAQSAQAQQASPSGASDNSTLGEVVVTGTRRTDRTVTDSASPVDIISAAELQAQPAANMLDQIKNVVPSFFVGQNTISDASSIVRAPSLRGLPSDEILVMLNGKRFNRSALVQVYAGGDTELAFGSQGSDLSSIPSIAIRNLEVLRDGATAQYGSDAIAGVLNYGLREDTGLEVQARYGHYQDHGDGKSYQYAMNGGLKFGTVGFVNLSAEYDDDGQTSRGVTRPIAVAFAQENPSLVNTLPNYPLPAQIWGQSPTRGYKLLLNSAFDVNDSSKLYLFGNIASNRTNESFNFRSSVLGTRPFTTTTGDVIDIGGRSFFQHPYYQTQCPAGNPTCPADGYVVDNNTFLLSSIYPGGFTPRFVGETTQSYGTVGYKGKTSGGVNYDLSASSSNNTVDLSMYDSISPSYGGASQRSFEFGKLIQKEFDLNLDLTYAIDAGLASPLTLSGGAEFRREEFTATAGDPQSYGAGPYASPHPLFVQTAPGVYTSCANLAPAACPYGTTTAAESPAASGYGGTSPTYAGAHTQNSHGFYLGLEGDVLKQLSVGTAIRYEDYSSFGSATVGKLNAIWHINDVVGLRATVGSGFHAPSPGQNNTQVLTTTFSQGVSLQQGTFPVTSAVAQYYGAKPLKPERSVNFGAGVVLKPSSDLTATIDIYKINVRDRIFISKSYTVTNPDIAALPELASVGAGGTVQYFTNSLDTTTKGIDLVGTYRMNALGGKLNLSLAYNYNKSEATKYDPAAIATYQIIDIERLAPNHRATLSANWSYGDLSINLRENYFGAWVDANDYPIAHDANGNVTAGQEFGAKLTTDLDVNYTFFDNYTATLGVSNLFNTYPDKVAASPDNPLFTLTGGTLDGQIYPRNGGPFGINGAFWYASLRVRFK